MLWKLIALTEPLIGLEIDIQSDMLIGRHPQSDIVLPSTSISRRHAVLRLHNEQLWLEDLSSVSGSFVNAEPVKQQQLHDQDELCFADMRFRVCAIPVQDAANAAQTDLAFEAKTDSEKKLSIDQGMPTLAERDAAVKIQADGMPASLSIPKPAPIPEHVQLEHQAAVKPTKENDDSQLSMPPVDEQQKNIKVGLISVLCAVLLILVAIVFFI